MKTWGNAWKKRPRVLKLVENWAAGGYIAWIIDAYGMLRGDDFGDLEKWMHQPRAIGRYDKRTQIFLKMQTEHSMRELIALKQKKNCAKHKLWIATKVTNPICAQRIWCIAGVNMRTSSEKWYLKHVEKELTLKEGTA